MVSQNRWRERVALAAVDVAGRVLRHTGRSLPGVAGPVLVAVGLGLAWLPLGVVAAGAILWAIDWRIPDESARTRPRYFDGRDRLRAVS